MLHRLHLHKRKPWTRQANAGRRLVFDSAGKLTRVVVAFTGEALTLAYDGQGHLLRVAKKLRRS